MADCLHADCCLHAIVKGKAEGWPSWDLWGCVQQNWQWRFVPPILIPQLTQLTPVSYYPMELIKLTWQQLPTLWALCHPSLSHKLQSFATWNVHPCDNGEITGTIISCGRDIVTDMTIILTIEEEITHGLPSDKHVWMPLQPLKLSLLCWNHFLWLIPNSFPNVGLKH
jgi:hypothetical protein